jgi:hypothetical protein
VKRIVLVLLAACGGSSAQPAHPDDKPASPPADSAIASYKKLRDEMCACTNVTCMSEVQREIRSLGESFNANIFSPPQAQEKQRLTDEADECAKHVPR